MLRPRLDVRHLSMIEAITQIGSISGAARSLGLTQPALSRQLQEAERRLGVELVHRRGKGLALTVAGETVLQCARRVLGDLADSERSAARIPEGPIVPLRVSLGHYDEYGWFANFFAYMAEHEPAMNLSIVNTGETDLQDALDNLDIDVAVLAGPFDRRHFRAETLFDDELVAIVHPDATIAKHPYLTAEHFADQTYATYGVTYHKGFESDRVLLPAGVWPQRSLSIGSARAILDVVQSGLAITVLSRWIAEPLRRSEKVKTICIGEDGLPISWSAVVRKSDGANSPAVRLASHLRRWCRRSKDCFVTGDEPTR